MPTPSTTRLLLAVAVSGFVTLTGGCDQMEADSRKADRVVQKSVDTAWEKINKSQASGLTIDPSIAEKADPQKFAKARETLEKRRQAAVDGKKDALKDLEAAAREANASLSEKIEAKSLLAATEHALAEDALIEIHRMMPAIRRAIWDLEVTGARLASVNAAIAALEGRDPAQTITGFGTSRKKVTDEGDAAAAKAKQLMDQVATIDAKIKELTQQRDAANTQADADADKASKAAAKEGNDLFNTVNENRKKAALLGHEIDKLAATKLPLERDAAIEMAKKAAADAGAASVDAAKTGTESEWTAIGAMIEDQKRKAAEIGTEVKAKSEALAALVKKATDEREKAGQLLTKAADHYKASATDASALKKQLQNWETTYSDAGQKVAWKSLRETYDPSIFYVLEGQSRHLLASMSLALANELQARKAMASTVKPAVDAAKVDVPDLAPTSLDADYKKAEETAKTQFAEAIRLYKTGGGYDQSTENLTNERYVGKLPKITHAMALFAQSLLPGVEAKPKDVKDLLESALGEPSENAALRGSFQSLPEAMRPAAGPAAVPPTRNPTTPTTPTPDGATPPVNNPQ